MASQSDKHAKARVGTVINQKYRLERLIGSGGMASVFQAVHQNNGSRVAIKMLHAHLAIDAELRPRFLREGYVANKVEHRGAVRVIDDDETEDGAVFLVMELLDGETLNARFERSGQKLPAPEVCELAYQLLDVLAAAHAKGVIHRDIKPENLFLTDDGVVKVLDFGIARLREAGHAHGATQTGRMIGTPAFMPPEQALGRSTQIDGQTDLWAVGATMFTLLSGQYVHEAETMEEMLIHAGSRQARPIAKASPSLPPAIASVVDRALMFAREDRWTNARAMEGAIEDAYLRTYGVRIPRTRGSSRSTFAAGAERRPAMRGAFIEPGRAPAEASVAPSGPDPLRGGRTQTASWAAPEAALRGLSTTAGVIHGADSKLRAPVGWSSRTRWGFWGTLGALAIVLAGGGAIFVMRPRVSAAPVSSVPAPPVAETKTIAPAPPPPSSAISTAGPKVAEPRTAASTSPPPPAPNANTAARSTAAPTRRPVAPSTPPLGVIPPQGALSARPSPGPNCEVPFYVDSLGIQRIRPECK
jgi:eukaryotic-like serine/threonine-protein kinase